MPIIESETTTGTIRQFMLKWLFAAACLFVGISGGVYTGMDLSGRTLGEPSPEARENSTFLDVGEMFPDYELLNVIDSTVIRVSDLTAISSVLLVFASSSCSACDMMNTFWRKRVLPKLAADVQVVWVFDAFESLSPENYDRLPKRVKIVTTQRDEQFTEDGITATPTLIGIQRGGAIGFIINGFDRRIGAEFVQDNIS